MEAKNVQNRDTKEKLSILIDGTVGVLGGYILYYLFSYTGKPLIYIILAGIIAIQSRRIVDKKRNLKRGVFDAVLFGLIGGICGFALFFVELHFFYRSGGALIYMIFCGVLAIQDNRLKKIAQEKRITKNIERTLTKGVYWTFLFGFLGAPAGFALYSLHHGGNPSSGQSMVGIFYIILGGIGGLIFGLCFFLLITQDRK